MGVEAKAVVKATEQEAVPVPLLLLVTTAGAQTFVPPLVKVTLPVGATLVVEAAFGVIVAVKVTVWLTTAVVGRLELTVLTGVFLVTTWVNCGEVEVLKLASPV